MGGVFTKAFKSLTSKNKMIIIMLGLDSVGKSTILYTLKLEEIVTTIPRIGFNIETVTYKNISFAVWDSGEWECCARRPLWTQCYQKVNAVIWVIDSNDRERLCDEDNGDNQYQMNVAQEVLHRKLADDELKDAVLLIFANKQDLPNVMDIHEILKRLKIDQIKHNWLIHVSCGMTGDGLYEGLDWLSNTLNKKLNCEPNPKSEETSWISKRNYELVLDNKKKSILLISG